MTDIIPDLPEVDLIDALAGIAPGSRLDLLRRERPVTRLHAQACQDTIFGPLTASLLSLPERHALAVEIATQHGAPKLAAFHADRLRDAGVVPAVERLAILSRLAGAMSLHPAGVTGTDLEALQAAGFSIEDIVVVGQLVGFIAYQARLLAGLSLLSDEVAA